MLIVVMAVGGFFVERLRDKTKGKRSDVEASLPPVGAEGTLERAGPSAGFCPANGAHFGWPCSKSSRVPVAPSSRVRVMKTGVFQLEGLCRYWVIEGAGASGDAPCEWFVAR